MPLVRFPAHAHAHCASKTHTRSTPTPTNSRPNARRPAHIKTPRSRMRPPPPRRCCRGRPPPPPLHPPASAASDPAPTAPPPPPWLGAHPPRRTWRDGCPGPAPSTGRVRAGGEGREGQREGGSGRVSVVYDGLMKLTGPGPSPGPDTQSPGKRKVTSTHTATSPPVRATHRRVRLVTS